MQRSKYWYFFSDKKNVNLDEFRYLKLNIIIFSKPTVSMYNINQTKNSPLIMYLIENIISIYTIIYRSMNTFN